MRVFSLMILLGGGLVSTAHADEAREWLNRSAKAETQSFQGTFVYERNGNFSTHGIWHQADADGGVRERLLQLDGPAQEVLRVNGQPQCVSSGLVDQLGDAQLPVSMLDPARLVDEYDLQMIGRSRIAGRNAVVLAMVPHDQHRYAVELYLDEQTSLPLKSLLISEKGQLLERFQYVSLDARSTLPDESLKPSEACKPVTLTKVSEPVKPSWQAGWVPPGFALNQSLQRKSPASADTVACLVYGDGLARFSVFIEPLHGVSVEDARSQLGPTAVISRRMSTADGDAMITVVGEIPLGTAERVALSMQEIQVSATE